MELHRCYACSHGCKSPGNRVSVEEHPFCHASRFKEAMILRTDRSIKRAFRVARDTSWSWEQTCLIIDRIPEEHHPLYLSDNEYEDL